MGKIKEKKMKAVDFLTSSLICIGNVFTTFFGVLFIIMNSPAIYSIAGVLMVGSAVFSFLVIGSLLAKHG